MAWSALCLIAPRLTALAVLGPVLATAGAMAARRTGRASPGMLVAALLAWVYAVTAWSTPSFSADSPSYYVYLRSVFFDGDLDFRNEWTTWGYPPAPPTATGLQHNLHSVGPAILWAPFFVLAHAYVLVGRLLGFSAYAADGFTPPYVRSAALGTATIAVLGAVLLFRTMLPRFGRRTAALAVAGTILASPVPYYLFVHPVMAHGVVFGVAGALVWAWYRAREAPSAQSWIVLGALLGVLTISRWQCAVYVALVGALAIESLVRRRARLAWIAAGALASVVAIVPQLIAWKILFGGFFASPERAHGMDWSSPHWVDVLISADRGLFSWTPLMLVGTVGLLAYVRRDAVFGLGALLVLAGSAWVNGGVADWAAANAFGARRFDLYVPLCAFGVAVAVAASLRALQRRPWLAPAAALLLLALWNAGFMKLYRQTTLREAAPLEEVARAQVAQVRRWTEEWLQRLGGPEARNLAYMFFVGEYFYWNLNLSGTIDVGAPEERYLAGGWSGPRRREGWPAFRWALGPESCVRIPLERGFDLRVAVTARAPRALADQTITLAANRQEVASHPLADEWTDVRFIVPARFLHGGENRLCLRFARGLSGEDEGAVAAAVSRIQLP